ncbi:hepatic lectin-like [Melanotaenia boesemani]|uniref:hepatic lectin-like n=1 Tax=Melanotaenia boesemani TaxID=1250792 RepID=UPI001C05EA8C|nr:hepatic lectin-like [Melanotaenia boesemani]
MYSELSENEGCDEFSRRPQVQLSDHLVYPARVAPRLSCPGFYRISTICLATLSVVLLMSIIAISASYKNKPQENSGKTSEMLKQDVNITVLMSTIIKLQEEKKELQDEKDELLVKLASKMTTKAPDGIKPAPKETQASTECPANWHLFDNSCYLISEDGMNWHQSKEHCQNQEGHLAIILTPEEQTFLWDLLPRGHWNSFWFGITDGETEDVWKWVDGSPVVGGFWEVGEPNNHINEDCGYIVKTEVLERVAIRSWYDAPCSMYLPFICEKKVDLAAGPVPSQ